MSRMQQLQPTLTLNELRGFLIALDTLPADLKRAFELALFNPTDAAAVVAEQFDAAGELEELIEMLEQAEDLHIKNAERASDLVRDWMNADLDAARGGAR
jgi:hypothetical protein